MRESRVAVTGRLADAIFRFQTDATDLAAYACAHLAPLATSGAGAPTVSVTLTWHDGQPPQRRPPDPALVAGLERVDRDVYTDGERLCWFRVDDLRDLFLRFRWKDEHLTVDADFYYRLGNSVLSDRVRRVRQWSRGNALRQRRFTTLLSYLVYYPCWWWLEQMRDLHPIHAAGVNVEAGVVLLAGASGVGKSTLAIALATCAGARLLGDSFVLHNGADIRAVHEPVLLDSWSRRWLGAQLDELRPIDGYFGLGRRGYEMSPQHTADAGRAALLLFPRRSPQSYLRQISSQEASQRLSAADLIINDLRRYWAFAAIMEQLAPAGLVMRREMQIARLAASVPCYEMGLAPDASSGAVTDSILRLMPDTRRRLAGARL